MIKRRIMSAKMHRVTHHKHTHTISLKKRNARHPLKNKIKYLHERIVIVIDVYIKNNMLKNRKPKLLRTLAPSFPMS